MYDNAKIKLCFSGVFVLAPRANNSDVTLESCLFGEVKLTKDADIDKCKYSGYGNGFDSKGPFSHPSGGFGKNLIIFGADTSSSAHANNKTRSILVLGKNFMQGIDGATIYIEKMYSTNFTVANKSFCLNLHLSLYFPMVKNY